MTNDNVRLGEHESPNSPSFWATSKDWLSQDMVNHPKHYNKGNPAYEPYKVISEWGLNFNIGNAVKYLARYKSKWNPIEDLEKAKKYIDFEIEALRLTESPWECNECSSRGQTCDCAISVDKEADCPSLVERSDDAARIAKTLDNVEKALDSGEDRIKIMRDILKMSDSEILDIMKISKPSDISRAIISKLVDQGRYDDGSRTEPYFTRSGR